MSAGNGQIQNLVLAEMNGILERDREYFEFPHEGRWFNLYMCKLITDSTPTSQRSARNRAVRGLAKTGQLEVRNKFPYELRHATPPIHTGKYTQSSSTAIEISDFDTQHVGRGRQLWFRRVGLAPLFSLGVWSNPLSHQPRRVIPGYQRADASQLVGHWADGSAGAVNIRFGHDRSSATHRFLEWYFFGEVRPPSPRQLALELNAFEHTPEHMLLALDAF